MNGLAPAKKEEKEEEGDDDFDPFKSDEEDDAEAERIKQERLAAYEAKKSKSIALFFSILTQFFYNFFGFQKQSVI